MTRADRRTDEAGTRRGERLTLFPPERTGKSCIFRPMTLEGRILQALGAGPVRRLTMGGVDADELAAMLRIMAARRQICLREDQVSLFWHRHIILSPRTAAAA